jgi:hypothetical protein
MEFSCGNRTNHKVYVKINKGHTTQMKTLQITKSISRWRKVKLHMWTYHEMHRLLSCSKIVVRACVCISVFLKVNSMKKTWKN